MSQKPQVMVVDDDLANWYVRRSRDRFYEVDGDDNRAAFATLHESLVVITRLLAPFAPFLTDWMHRELAGESVHLAPFVRANPAPRDPPLEEAMDAIRQLATLARLEFDEADTIQIREDLARMIGFVEKTAGIGYHRCGTFAAYVRNPGCIAGRRDQRIDGKAGSDGDCTGY